MKSPVLLLVSHGLLREHLFMEGHRRLDQAHLSRANDQNIVREHLHVV